jgi:hypothetical protein|nr:MAG TPA: hypothetical protein [Caudoviricetes sp.]
MLHTPTIDTFGLAQASRDIRDAAAIQAQFRNDVDELIYKSLETARGGTRIILADYFADFLEDAFGATDDADTLRSEERVAVRDAQTDEEEEEAVRRHPW